MSALHTPFFALAQSSKMCRDDGPSVTTGSSSTHRGSLSESFRLSAGLSRCKPNTWLCGASLPEKCDVSISTYERRLSCGPSWIITLRGEQETDISDQPVKSGIMPPALPAIVQRPVGSKLAFHRYRGLESEVMLCRTYRGFDEIVSRDEKVVRAANDFGTDG